MRARQLLAVLLGTVVLAGCASAADVAASQRADKVEAKPTPTHQAPDPTTSTTRTPPPTPTPSEPTKTAKPAPPSTPPPSTPRTRTLPNVVGAIPTFLTPSHNIGCAISGNQVRCDIAEHSYRNPPRPADCQGAYGQSIAVTRNGIAAFACVTDTVISPRAPVLAYTTSTVVGDFGCTSRQAGIRCYYLPSPHGFWLSRDQPALF